MFFIHGYVQIQERSCYGNNNLATGHFLAWIRTNDPIDFVSQADFLAHRSYYAKVVKVLAAIIEWGECFTPIDGVAFAANISIIAQLKGNLVSHPSFCSRWFRDERDF